jgi:hypothetical protein
MRFRSKYAGITHKKYNLPVCRHILWQEQCNGFRLNLVLANQTLLRCHGFGWLWEVDVGKWICDEMTIVEECQTRSRVTSVTAVTESLRTHTHTHRSAVQIVAVGH